MPGVKAFATEADVIVNFSEASMTTNCGSIIGYSYCGCCVLATGTTAIMVDNYCFDVVSSNHHPYVIPFDDRDCNYCSTAMDSSYYYVADTA